MYFSLPSIVLSGFVTIRPSRTLCLFRTGYLYFARQISMTAGVCQVPADICSVVSPKAIPITNLFMVDSALRPGERCLRLAQLLRLLEGVDGEGGMVLLCEYALRAPSLAGFM